MYNFFSKRLNGNRKGFTLVELLVVMAILAVLIAIAVMNMGTTTVSAKVSRHNAQVREVYSAATMWFANNTNMADTVTIEAETDKQLDAFFNKGKRPKPEYKVALNAAEGAVADIAVAADNFKITIEKTGKITVEPGLMKVNDAGKAAYDKAATEALQGPQQ